MSLQVETPQRHVDANVAAALREDIGPGDVSAALIPEGVRVSGSVLSREQCVLCGTAWFETVFSQLNPEVKVTWKIAEGERVLPKTTLCTFEGPARAVLSGERVALNFLQMMSAVAWRTRRYADRVKGTRAKIMDTRKTIPGLRVAQKYAVVIGGGEPHRLGLFDAVMIKENHIAALGSIADAAEQARSQNPDLTLIIETENLNQVEEALNAKADVILLDNFGTHLLSRAVAMGVEYRRYNKGHSLMEASGNISLENVREIADTGVDRISIGGLTKHIQAVDLSLRLDD